ncbi:peptidoglycan D,D-transpeptidase FtsI family protein [Raoultibacter timonensis]|uniref:Cell division protein FtsI n=1 Tax=Raoultibacter timonensis TaxID=1907662 RepID=A0ABM7WKA1_9ACTN|nr:penicillin-binding protein 2 [Raoultibacter timonensis]BDE96746.1 cell division protein FtsI [Raoultibacter timonensis]BDF51349.1 cell division protein FtsI [Raoultibacter timonensis]
MADKRGHRSSGSRRSGSGRTAPRSSSANFIGSDALADGSNRAAVAIAVFAVIALVFVGRLVYLQVIKSSEYSAMAQESRTANIETSPRRGTIYDRNGYVLATSVDATTIYANPYEVTDAKGEAKELAEILGGEAADYEALLTKDDISFVYIKRKADVEVADRVKELKLAGIYFLSDTKREYPYGQIGGQVIGTVNIDGEGLTGLELQYDDVLSGTGGKLVVERGRDGTPIPGGVKEEVAAVDGQDIIISLDISLQEKVEESLTQGVKDVNGESGNAIVMDAGTGEIYAAASLPLYDPNDLSTIVDGSETQAKSITQIFEPGSIFKTVSTMAILENGVMGPEDEIFCPAVIEADEYQVSDAHERGDETMTLRQILDNSSNVGISLSVEKLGFTELYNKIVKYNLNELTGVDYPGEGLGSLLPREQWAKITGYNISFGQGVSVTPLQMVRFYGALINDGVEVTPHFLVEKPLSDETPAYATEDVVDNKEAIPTITSMLETVVSSGTGTGAQIEGYRVAGKTSTAEIAEEGVYKKDVYNLCFTGFLPDSSSQLVCFVGANEVPGGGNVSSVFKDIMAFAIDRYKIMPN